MITSEGFAFSSLSHPFCRCHILWHILARFHYFITHRRVEMRIHLERRFWHVQVGRVCLWSVTEDKSNLHSFWKETLSGKRGKEAETSGGIVRWAISRAGVGLLEWPQN